MFYALIRKVRFKNQSVFAGLFSGALWNIGNLLSIITISFLGLARGYPLTQATVLVSVLWGVLCFKESTSRKDMLKIIGGTVVLVLGVMTLGAA